jgi:hypothetical protein
MHGIMKWNRRMLHLRNLFGAEFKDYNPRIKRARLNKFAAVSLLFHISWYVR